MGFRNNTYATVWEVDVKSDTFTSGRISISHKNKETGEYETDFTSYVGFVGTAISKRAASLQPKARIKLKSVDVTNKYDKETKKNYYSFKIYDFEILDSNNSDSPSETASEEQSFEVDSNQEEGDGSGKALPF